MTYADECNHRPTYDGSDRCYLCGARLVSLGEPLPCDHPGREYCERAGEHIFTEAQTARLYELPCPNCQSITPAACPLCATYGTHGGPCFHGLTICANDAIDGMTLPVEPRHDPQEGVSALCLLTPDHDGAHSDGIRVWTGVSPSDVPCMMPVYGMSSMSSDPILCERGADHDGHHMSALHILASARHISKAWDR